MANPFYQSFKEAILHDMTELDMDKAYPVPPMPGSGCLITAMGQKPFGATVTMVVQTFEADGTEVFIIDWLSADGTLRGTAKVSASYLTQQPPGPPKLAPDSMIKTYSHPDQHWNAQPGSFFSYQSNSDTPNPYAPPHYAPKPEPDVDLSQIEADLAKLPPVKSQAMADVEAYNTFLKGQSPLQQMAATIHEEDIKAAMKLVSETTGKGYANAEKQFKLTEEQFLKYGEIFLEAASGKVIPIGVGEIKLAHDSTPIGKLHEYKETDGGLEFSVALTKSPKKIKGKKQQEENAEHVMKAAIREACDILWGGLHSNPWPDKLNTLNGVHSFQLADGTMLEVLLTVKPKEVKP